MAAFRSTVASLLSLAAAVLAPLAVPAASRAAETSAPQPYAADFADPARPLSPADARLYAQAFEAMRRGDGDRGAAIAGQISDPLLMGRLAFVRMMAPGYHADYAELKDWLQRYRDQPEADRVYTLAKKRRPNDVALPAGGDAGPAADPTWARVEQFAARREAGLAADDLPAPDKGGDPRLQQSREAFYGGDINTAYQLSHAAGEHWVGGLSAFRLGRYDESLEDFSTLLDDPAQNEWVRSAAGYWAARAATAAGRPQASPAYLRIAARTPYTFYGLIAERQLGQEPSVADAPTPEPIALARATPAPRGPMTADAAALIATDARARRAAGLAQVGLRLEAGLEARTAMMSAGGGEGRKAWLSLALALGAPLSSPADLSRTPQHRFDLAQFPTPELNPEGGFTLDKALVYALVRQESRFNAGAASAAGAYGLMQLTPATAARVAGDARLAHDPTPLLDARKNLKLGQAYVGKLLDLVQGDLVRAVASYNSGPGTILKTVKALGDAADTLLIIESMPGGQTREYVEKVMANYWIYRHLLGHTSTTLDAAASGAHAIPVSLDG